jgi:hypothetical protein
VSARASPSSSDVGWTSGIRPGCQAVSFSARTPAAGVAFHRSWVNARHVPTVACAHRFRRRSAALLIDLITLRHHRRWMACEGSRLVFVVEPRRAAHSTTSQMIMKWERGWERTLLPRARGCSAVREIFFAGH